VGWAGHGPEKKDYSVQNGGNVTSIDDDAWMLENEKTDMCSYVLACPRGQVKWVNKWLMMSLPDESKCKGETERMPSAILH